MRICGLTKTTLLDFPGRLSAIIFLGGCNLRCPFCHNSALAFDSSCDEIPKEEVFDFLKKRRGIIDGVCISGGEPLMNNEIIPFIKEIKDLGYSIKLDTNGCFPQKLKEVLESGLLDYVAMDIKNSLPLYGKTVGNLDFDTSCIKESIRILEESKVAHEFRTTVAKGLHTKESMADLAKLIKGTDLYFIQGFKKSDAVPDESLKEFSDEELKGLLKTVKSDIPHAQLRGV